MKTKKLIKEAINIEKGAGPIPSKLCFNAKFYGQQQVPEAGGDDICENAMAMLKTRQAQTKQKKKRVMIDLHPTEIYILEKSDLAKCICHHSLCDLTFVWNDPTGDHCCGLILRQTAAGKSTWEFYGFKLNGYRTAFIHALKYVFRNLELSNEQMPKPNSNLPPASCMDNAVVDNLIDLTDISTKPNAIHPKTGEQLFQVKIPTRSLILPPNPTRMRHNQIAHSFRSTGLTSRTIIGPFFFSQNVTASSYKEMLQTWVIPRLHAEGLLSTVWWQQDGAPAHSARTVSQFLDDTFGHRWIGRGGPMEWPARSPDMNPLDFFLWGYLKRRVYKVKPTCVEELKRSIVEECRAISVDTLQRVIANSIRRMLLCQQNGGGHFEHLLR